jgi:serine/threonine-protein kinase
MTHPERLGKYPITGVLGEGAMGVVYKGFDPGIRRPVAIKTIRKQLSDDNDAASFAARFRNEAQAVGRLSHPGIVAIYEYGEEGDTTYIAMEFVEGKNLSQILAGTPMLVEADILRVMDQLLDALDCAHRHGVWHRDIKPANLIVTSRGQVKVTDFGIARIESLALTQVTSVIGTPGYMAPEQYNGLKLDQRVDIFAAGVILYRMLAGRLPFAGTPETVMYKILNETPLPPSRAAAAEAARPVWFDPIVAKALAKDPAQRFQSAADFRQALADGASRFGTGYDSTLVIASPAAAPPPIVPLAAPITPAAAPSTGAPPSPLTAGTGDSGGKTTGGTLLTASSISGWDVKTLAPIETALATVIGPVAKVMVRQAARICPDMATLTARVAEQIGDLRERERFLTQMATLPPMAAPMPAGAATGPSGAMQAALSPAVIEQATRVMTAYMGPIARIVTRKASAQATSIDHFYGLLAEEVNDGSERVKVLQALRRGT